MVYIRAIYANQAVNKNRSIFKVWESINGVVLFFSFDQNSSKHAILFYAHLFPWDGCPTLEPYPTHNGAVRFQFNHKYWMFQ